MMFRFNGNSQFDVTIFDQVGREKACSVVVDDSLDPNVQEGRTDATETLNSYRAHSQPVPMQSPATETLNHSHAHPQPMPIQLPTETVNHFHAPHCPMQMPIENMALSRAQDTPAQMQSPPTYRWTQVKRDNLRYSLPSEDQGCRVGVIPDPIIGRRTKLNPVQEKSVTKRYVDEYLRDEKFISLSRLGGK